MCLSKNNNFNPIYNNKISQINPIYNNNFNKIHEEIKHLRYRTAGLQASNIAARRNNLAELNQLNSQIHHTRHRSTGLQAAANAIRRSNRLNEQQQQRLNLNAERNAEKNSKKKQGKLKPPRSQFGMNRNPFTIPPSGTLAQALAQIEHEQEELNQQMNELIRLTTQMRNTIRLFKGIMILRGVTNAQKTQAKDALSAEINQLNDYLNSINPQLPTNYNNIVTRARRSLRSGILTWRQSWRQS